MISICVPTRGRPEIFKRLCVSVLDNASNPDDIEFVSYHDNDDPSVYEYVGNHKQVVADRIIQSAMFNECYKIATGPIYMFLPDDMVFYSKDWDKYVKEAFDRFADKILFVYPNDEHWRSRYGQVGFLHKNWIEAVGYFLPPYFAAGYADFWINRIAYGLRRRIFLGPVIVKHLGILEDKTHFNDKTHQEYLKKGEDAGAIYYSKGAERLRDAQLLQDFIDNFKSR